MDIKNIKKEWNAAILDILKTFISICHTHNLRYYCCAGTAIGAVRHHGMIPWDDDIDVIMPRPDYDRFLEIARHEDFGNYEVVTPYNNERYPLYFSKLVNKNTTLIEEKERPCIIGLFVDIFPLDATADDVEQAKALQRKYVKHINCLNAISTRNTFGEYLTLLTHRKTWGRFVVKTTPVISLNSCATYAKPSVPTNCSRSPLCTTAVTSIFMAFCRTSILLTS